MGIFINLFMGASVFVCGALSVAWTQAMRSSPDSTVIEQILGPLGALALALSALWIIVRYLLKLQRRLENIQDERLEDQRKEAEYWRERAEKHDD